MGLLLRNGESYLFRSCVYAAHVPSSLCAYMLSECSSLNVPDHCSLPTFTSQMLLLPFWRYVVSTAGY